MAFTPKTWQSGSGGGTPITATELNRIEAGIVEAANTLSNAAPGSMFVCPLNGTVNTSASTARPSSRTDIFFTWRTTVEPTNALPGDEIVFQDA